MQGAGDEEKDELGKLSDLCRGYYKYQEFQRSKAVIDFDDMVMQAAELLKRKPPAFLLRGITVGILTNGLNYSLT